MPAILEVHANEATAAQRRVYFQLWLNATAPGISPATGVTGQPEISTNGGAWTSAGAVISTLTEIGNGRYYADLSQAAVATAGNSILTRMLATDCHEAEGWSVRVVGFDPNSAALGMLRLKKNTAGQRVFFYIRDAASPQEGLLAQSPTISRSIDGAVGFTVVTGTVSEIGRGYYCLTTSAADTNGDDIIFFAECAGGISTSREAYTHAA